MNPPCAKCSKTVYPTEKLNCLDKVKTGADIFSDLLHIFATEKA